MTKQNAPTLRERPNRQREAEFQMVPAPVPDETDLVVVDTTWRPEGRAHRSLDTIRIAMTNDLEASTNLQAHGLHVSSQGRGEGRCHVRRHRRHRDDCYTWLPGTDPPARGIHHRQRFPIPGLASPVTILSGQPSSQSVRVLGLTVRNPAQ